MFETVCGRTYVLTWVPGLLLFGPREVGLFLVVTSRINYSKSAGTLGQVGKRLDERADVQKETHKTYWPYLAIVTIGLESVDYVSV